jgi:zinc protease
MKTLGCPRLFNAFLLKAAALALAVTPLLALAQADKPAEVKKSDSSKLPPAKEIIAKFVTAIGGKEAFRKIESQHAKGNFEMAAQGLKGKLEVVAKRPNKLFVKINIPAFGDVTTGFDGKTGWSLNAATGPMLMEGKQLEQMRDQADFDSVLHEEEDFKSMETVEKTEFEGKETYKLKLVKKSGQESIEYYDTKTGLLLGSLSTQESPLGAVEVTNILAEYKKFGDVLFATKITQKLGPIEQVMIIDSFELNKVEDSAFALPDAIKALVAEKK